MDAATLQIGYMAAAGAAALLIQRLSIFDLRSIKRRRKPEGEASAALDMLDRPDLGAMLNVLVVVGTAVAVLIGWRIPAEIERIWGEGASFGILFPSVDMTTIGRAAQVVGALCFGMIALRLLRILVLFAAAAMAGAGGLAALDYIFQLNWVL